MMMTTMGANSYLKIKIFLLVWLSFVGVSRENTNARTYIFATFCRKITIIIKTKRQPLVFGRIFI